MPCDTVNTVSLDLGKLDHETLFAALQALGKQPEKVSGGISFTHNGYRCSFRDGQLDMRGRSSNYDETINAIKRGYSEQVIKSQAKRFGWQVTAQESQDKKQLKFKLQARSRS